MAASSPCSPLGPDETEFSLAIAGSVLTTWRQEGLRAAQQTFHTRTTTPTSSALLHELEQRLAGAQAPHLLVDGVWFSQPHGGITRVWEQILRCWRLPGLVTSAASVTVIDRESRVASIEGLPQCPAAAVDPLDWQRLPDCSDDNGRIAMGVGADVFVSTWITSTGRVKPALPELALVHDCIPERNAGLDPQLRALRNRWLLGATGHLAVSAATAADLAQALGSGSRAVPWCHPSTAHLFMPQPGEAPLEAWTDQLIHRLALPSCFVLLPASSSIGSYKNPEVVLEALSSHALHSVHLLLTGVAAQRHAERYRECYPDLRDRIHVHALNDLELQCLYRKALAVVVPSRREGFGLPVLEAMASGGRVLTMDVAGLREAASGAVPCLDPEDADLLRLWLELLLDAPSRAWLTPHLARRRRARLERLNPDLLGLTLLAQARRLANRQSR